MNIYFTIIIPTLNEEAHLPHLLDDLSKQTFKDFRVVVVDANSKDKTRSIAKKYKTDIVLSDKKNVSFQRNLGVESCSSDWIVFMDADNRFTKTYLQKVRHHLEVNDPDILSTWIKSDSKLKKDRFTATVMNLFMEINQKSSQPYILESMIFVKKSSFNALEGFNINIPWREGEDLLKRAHKMGMKFEFIKNPKYTYSFRRFKKIGAFKMFQEMSQMEIIKILKGGKLTKKDTLLLYPMKGGSFYNKGDKRKMKLQDFISILFQDNTVDSKSVRSFKKSLNAWKRFFR